MRTCPKCHNIDAQAPIYDVLNDIRREGLDDIYDIDCKCTLCNTWWTEFYNDTTGEITVVEIHEP